MFIGHCVKFNYFNAKANQMKKYAQFLFFFMLLHSLADVSAQSSSIQGVVLEQGSNIPLAGVNILVEDSSVGTITDLDGSFTLEIENAENARLLFSYLGYKSQRVELDGNNQALNISLQIDATSLDEVVVIGSSITSSRRKLGNSVTSLESDLLLKVTPVNITNALQGKIPGAQITQNSGDPAGGFSVRLRGPSTIKGTSEPLYVVDGVIASNLTTNVTNLNVGTGDGSPGQNRMVDINPNDIQDISVLNGAAAAAIYGSRASNGVIMITTKKGSNLTDGPELFFKTSFNINQLRKRLDLNLTGEEFETVPNSPLSGRLWPIFGFDPDNNLTTFRYLSQNKFNTTRYDYQDNIFGTGIGNDSYLSMRGGTDKIGYFASLGYLTNGGIIQNTNYNRLSARLNFNHIVTDWLSYDFGFYFANSKSDEKPDGNVFWSPVNAVNITNNTFDITQRDGDGNLLAVENTRVNPLSIIETFDINQNVSRIIPSLHVKLYPFKNLTVNQILGVDSYTQEGNILIPVYPYANVNPAYFNDGYKSNATAEIFNWNYDINVGYQYDISDDIGSETTVGYSFQASELTFDGEQGRGLNSAGEPGIPLQTNPIDAKLDIYGFFLQETFSMYDKFFLTLAGRVDGATNFDVDKRSNFYPKVSGSYVLVDGSSASSFINSARIRGSYGEAGNLTAISPFERFGSFAPVDFQGNQTLQQNSRLGNPNLVPERTKEFEVGTDLSFLDNRVALLATYYSQNIEDLIVSRVLAPSIGGSSRTENVGTMENKGFELYSRVTAMKTKDLTWDVNLNFSTNKNKVTKTTGGDIIIANVLGAPPVVREGEPLGVFYGTYYATNSSGEQILTGPSDNGVAEGTPQPERGDVVTNTPMRDAQGQPTGDLLRKIIGDPNPDFILGLGTNLSYKSFSFSMLWESVQGFDIFDADKRTRQGVGLGRIAEQELKGEIVRGYIAGIYPIQEFRMEDGSFTKLREISLAYTLPSVGSFSNLNVALSGRNLFSIDNFFSYDPEVNAGGQSNLLRSTNFGTVPIPRTISLSLSANF